MLLWRTRYKSEEKKINVYIIGYRYYNHRAYFVYKYKYRITAIVYTLGSKNYANEIAIILCWSV